MLAPSHGQISTTVYLHAQFVASLARLRHSANTDFKEGLALHNSKVKKRKVLFYAFFFVCFCLFFFFLKKGQESSNTVLHVETTEEEEEEEEEEYIVIDKVQSRSKSPSASNTVEVCSSLHGHTSGDSSSSQYRKHNNVA